MNVKGTGHVPGAGSDPFRHAVSNGRRPLSKIDSGFFAVLY